jgi:Family of unknown function (DUF6368)
MSGATAQILLPETFSDLQRSDLLRYIEFVSNSTEGRNFWVGGQPFGWYETAPDEDESNIVVSGWSPKAVIGFYAGCRGQISDAYLAMLVSKVAQMFGGVIAFGDRISLFADDAFILTIEGRVPHGGQDLLTPDFMHQWISHPKFRMVN